MCRFFKMLTGQIYTFIPVSFECMLITSLSQLSDMMKLTLALVAFALWRLVLSLQIRKSLIAHGQKLVRTAVQTNDLKVITKSQLPNMAIYSYVRGQGLMRNIKSAIRNQLWRLPVHSKTIKIHLDR
jgi:hypothetical protein